MPDTRHPPLPEIATTAEAAEAEALPRARLVRIASDDPDCEGPDCPEDGPDLPAALSGVPLSRKSPAQWAYERVILYIRDFESDLDVTHEIAMGFTGAAAGVMRIDGVGYYDPDIVTFTGLDGDGNKTQMIQHVSQLNVVLKALPRPDPDAQPRRIGFRLARALDGEAPTAAPKSQSKVKPVPRPKPHKRRARSEAGADAPGK